MAQNENYSQVDLRVGTEEQFNAKVGTLPAGTLFGITDSTVSKADLSTDLKNEINGKINKPTNPTAESAITINSSGTISTKPLASITGKTEVAVSSTAPTGDEILWIDTDGTSSGSLGGEKVSLTFPAGASEGTITEEQLAVLQASESNYIEMVNDKELYYLNDHGHTDGYLTYSHVGIENSKATIKTLTITVSAKSFVIVTTVVPTESGGGKLYRHQVGATLRNTVNNVNMSVLFIYYRSDMKSFKTPFDSGDYSVIRDLKYSNVLLTYYKPEDSAPPCQGIGMLDGLSDVDGQSPILQSSNWYGVVYSMSGSYYYSFTYPVAIIDVSGETITEL